jgi:hypothetical protein
MPLGLWVDGWLRLWRAQPGAGCERLAVGFGFRLFLAALLTDALAYLDYFAAFATDGSFAGLATAGGRPIDTDDQ